MKKKIKELRSQSFRGRKRNKGLKREEKFSKKRSVIANVLKDLVKHELHHREGNGKALVESAFGILNYDY